MTGECLGLLIEDQRTNQIKDSYDLTQQSWSDTNITRKSFTTETLAPNGKYEATKIASVSYTHLTLPTSDLV